MIGSAFNASDAARPPRRFPLGGLFAEKRENHRKAAIFALIRAGLVSFPPLWGGGDPVVRQARRTG